MFLPDSWVQEYDLFILFSFVTKTFPWLPLAPAERRERAGRQALITGPTGDSVVWCWRSPLTSQPEAQGNCSELSSQSQAGRELTAGELLRGAGLVGEGGGAQAGETVDSEKVGFCDAQTLLFARFLLSLLHFPGFIRLHCVNLLSPFPSPHDHRSTPPHLCSVTFSSPTHFGRRKGTYETH